jgi:hypothetical protein
MMHSVGTGRGGEQHPELAFICEVLKGVRSSGQFYFFAGGGSTANEDLVTTGRAVHPEHFNLLQEIPWRFSSDLQSPHSLVVAEVYGRSRDNAGGGDLVVGLTASSSCNPEDRRLILLACHIRQFSLERMMDFISRNPASLQKALGIFDSRFETGELKVASAPSLYKVTGTVTENPETGTVEFVRGRLPLY